MNTLQTMRRQLNTVKRLAWEAKVAAEPRGH
jgi:hypothetical protein